MVETEETSKEEQEKEREKRRQEEEEDEEEISLFLRSLKGMKLPGEQKKKDRSFLPYSSSHLPSSDRDSAIGKLSQMKDSDLHTKSFLSPSDSKYDDKKKKKTAGEEEEQDSGLGSSSHGEEEEEEAVYEEEEEEETPTEEGERREFIEFSKREMRRRSASCFLLSSASPRTSRYHRDVLSSLSHLLLKVLTEEASTKLLGKWQGCLRDESMNEEKEEAEELEREREKEKEKKKIGKIWKNIEDVQVRSEVMVYPWFVDILLSTRTQGQEEEEREREIEIENESSD